MEFRPPERSSVWIPRSRRSLIAIFAVTWLAGLSPLASSGNLPFDNTNIAPSVPYTLIPKPNADYAPEKTSRELTDGIRSFGRFWSNGQSVGWEKRSPIKFRQDFKEEVAIRGVEIGTGKNSRSMIALPSHALVYVAGNDGRYALVGDARQNWQHDTSVPDGTTTLVLNFEPVTARYVEIVFFRDSPFVFLDEVRILSAKSGAHVGGSLAEEQIIDHAVARRRSEAEKRAGLGPLGRGPAERLSWPLPPQETNTTAAQCLATRISPWVEGTAQGVLAAPSLAGASSLHVAGGWLVGAFRVENPTAVEQAVHLSFSGGSGVGIPRASAVGYVLGLDYTWRADVVQPSDGIVLPPNSFAMLVAEAPVSGTGEIRLEAAIKCGSNSTNFDLTGRSIPIKEEDRPFGNLWSYLVGPIARTQSCWPTFHEDFGVDTAVVNETALNRRINKNAETLLRTYLRTFSNSRRLLLYMEMTDTSWPQGGDESALEAELTTWWKWVSNILEQENFKGSVAIYPIDEVKPDQVPRLNMITRIFRRIAPGTPLYGTVANAPALASVDLDIVQAHDSIIQNISPEITRRKEIYIYSTKPLGKTLDLSRHYRRLSWNAFGASLRGSGFWAMWDASGISLPQLGWSDFGGAERDYSVVYGSPDGCIYPSRRLMAWRRGLEDFAVLSACRHSSGEDLRTKVQAFARREDQNADDYDSTLSSLTLSCVD